jgi:hypothetical protein
MPEPGGPAAGRNGGDARADRRIAAWLAACAALVYLPFCHGHLTGSDEVGVFLSTASLWERGDLAIGPGQHVFEGRDGRRYSIFAIGQSLLALPFYAAGDVAEQILPREWLSRAVGRTLEGMADTWETPQVFAVTLYAPLATGALVGLYFLFQRRLGASRRSALWASLLFGVSTYVAMMSVYFLQHTTEALAILGSLYALLGFRQGGGLRDLAAGSLLASLTVLIRVPSSVAGAALAAYLVFVLVQRARGPDGLPPLARVASAVALPAVLVAAVHVGINQIKWGTWIASPMLDQQRFLTVDIRVGIAGLLVSPGSSIFVYSPPLLLLPFTLRGFWREHRAECLTTLAIVVSVLLIAAPFQLWHGMWSSPGPRMLFVATPLLMLPLGPWLDGRRSRPWCAVVALLGLAGAVVQLGLLTAKWRSVVDVMGYRKSGPEVFLFEPALSPALASLRGLWRGEVDVWLLTLFRGAPGREPAPEVGAAVLLVWAISCLACALRLRRAVADA